MYEKELKELGLTDNEVRIYLILLKEGSMNPSEISQKLGLHRGYIYDALERMQEKEVVNNVLKLNKKQFQATSPKNLIELLKLKLENFQRILPDLENIYNSNKESTKIELHKGKKVFRTLLKDISSSVKKNETYYLFGINEKILYEEVEPIYVEQYLNSIKSKNLKEKIIIEKGGDKIKNSNLEYRELDKKDISKYSQFFIYGNKVAIFILGEPYYLIIIESQKVSEAYMKQFNLLWNIAKK